MLDFGEVAADDVRYVEDRGATFVRGRITPQNYRTVLGEHVGPGDLVIDLAWNIDTVEVLTGATTRTSVTSTPRLRSDLPTRARTANRRPSALCTCGTCACARCSSAGVATRAPQRCSTTALGPHRPTVHYAYCPADAAIASLHELQMCGYELQERQRIMYEDIVDGRDALGRLLMGHPFKSWWIGSLLDIHETRRLVGNHNATTLQVAASVLAATRWMLDQPSRGRLPARRSAPRADARGGAALPGTARVTLGRLDAAPALARSFRGYGRPRPADEDVWQFSTFLVPGLP